MNPCVWNEWYLVLVVISGLLVYFPEQSLCLFEPPRFEWSSNSRSLFGIPDLNVFFPDGTSDGIELEPYFPFPDMKETLCFMGKLKSDSDSIVVVTGILLNYNLDVSIHRGNHDDITVHVDSNGVSHTVTRGEALPILEKFQGLKDSNILRGFSEVMPSFTRMRLVIGYTKSLENYFESFEDFKIALSQILAHVQGYFLHPTLGFQVIIELPPPILDLRSKTTISSSSLEDITSALSVVYESIVKDGNGDHLSIFVHDLSNDSDVGRAAFGGMCSERNSSLSVIEIRSSLLATALTFTHELGHSFGAYHTEGIMANFVQDTQEYWSSSSLQEIHEHYKRVLESVGKWCLKEEESPISHWTNWTPYSDCSRPCGAGVQIKKRFCQGIHCPGSSEMSLSCNTQPCEPCVDKSSKCGKYHANNDCQYKYESMKKKCRKTCHKDISTNCSEYKRKGYCKETSQFNFMVYRCAATCNYFCFDVNVS